MRVIIIVKMTQLHISQKIKKNIRIISEFTVNITRLHRMTSTAELMEDNILQINTGEQVNIIIKQYKFRKHTHKAW